MTTTKEISEKFYHLLRGRKYWEAMKLVDNLIAEHVPFDKILFEIISPAINRIQDYFAEGYKNVSAFQVLAVAKIASDTIKKLEILMERKESQKLGVVVIGNIKNDFHGLGKDLVKIFLMMKGWDVIDLGLSVPPERFVTTAINENALAILVSGMMMHTIINIKLVRKIMDERGLTGKIPLIVGGAPFIYNPELYKELGADAVAKNAYEAHKILLSILEGENNGNEPIREGNDRTKT
ncbi:MAG: cobalamin B12-binding domain-containing protein [Candidatus Asgardarchaeia archaeon]